MMRPKQEAQAALFHQFSLEEPVPQAQLLTLIDRLVDLWPHPDTLCEFKQAERSWPSG